MRRLPVLSTVASSYRFAFGNLRLLADIAKRWMIAAAAAFGLSYALVALGRSGDPSGSTAFDQLPPGARVNALAGLSIIIIALAMYVIIVRWHRLIINHVEPAQTRRAALSAGLLYFARLLFLGAGGASIFVLGGLVPITLLREVPLPQEIKSYLPVVIVTAAFASAFLTVGRLSLILPGGAVGDHAMNLRKSWAVTRGNSWRMVLGSALASGPAMIANLGVNLFATFLPTTSADVLVLTVVLILSLALVVFTAVIQASFLSYAYLFFVGSGSDHIVHAPPALER